MCILSYLLVYFILLQPQNEAARILAVFPIPSISHQVVFRPLTQELARRGHDVTVITTDPAFPKGETPTNLTEIDIHDISYEICRKTFTEPTKGKTNDVYMVIDVIMHVVPVALDVQLQDEKLKNLIRDTSKRFDLLLVESCVRPVIAFNHIYKVPVIQISSLGAVYNNYAAIGAPLHPLLYPDSHRQRFYNLTMWEKITELYLNYKLNKLYEDTQPLDNAMLKKHFGANTPPVSELENNVDMLFINLHPVFEGNRPVPRSVVHLGGLHQTPAKDLPADLKSYLDSSKHGVIYISFGTNVDPTHFPPDRIEVLVKTLSQLPYDVLWKWNNEVLPGRTNNIRISKWLPQSDLLKHPKIKVFITQAGLQSTDEAITAGVPLIALPMFGDQWYNAEKYEYFKIGIKLLMEKLTAEQFKNAINTVIEDKSYRMNINKLRSIMGDDIQKPLERAVLWIEYVLRHGGAKHLRSPAANISLVEYLEIELIFTLLSALLIVTFALILLLRLVHKLIKAIFVTDVEIKVLDK